MVLPNWGLTQPFDLLIACREVKGSEELEEHQSQSLVGSSAEKKILGWKYKYGEQPRTVPAASLHAAAFSLQFGVSWERKSQDVSLFVQTEVL